MNKWVIHSFYTFNFLKQILLITSGMTSLKITIRLTFSEYWKTTYITILRRPVMIIIYYVILQMLVSSISDLSNKTSDLRTAAYMQLIFVVLIMFLLPYILYTSAKRRFLSGRSSKEDIEYTFSDKEILMKGETFNIVSKWENISKIREFTAMFLIYESRRIMAIIPKKDLSENEVNSLRSFFNEIPIAGIKKLK